MNERTDVSGGIDSAKFSSSRYYIHALVFGHTVFVLIAFELFTVGLPNYSWPRWQSIFIEGLAISQTGLLVTWLAFGNTAFAIRVGSVVFIITFWVMALYFIGLEHEYWFNILAIYASGAGIALLVARLFGVMLNTSPAAAELPIRRAYSQFSLWQMLTWVTIVAFVLFFIKLERQFWGTRLDYGKAPRSLAMGFLFVPVALVAVWAVLGSHRKWLALVLVALVTVLASLGAGRIDTLVRSARWSSLDPMAYEIAYWQLVSFTAVLYCLSLACVYCCGYRLVKPPKVM